MLFIRYRYLKLFFMLENNFLQLHIIKEFMKNFEQKSLYYYIFYIIIFGFYLE